MVNLGGVQFQGETMAHAAASLNSKAPPLFEIKIQEIQRTNQLLLAKSQNPTTAGQTLPITNSMIE